MRLPSGRLQCMFTAMGHAVRQRALITRGDIAAAAAVTAAANFSACCIHWLWYPSHAALVAYRLGCGVNFCIT